MRQVEHSVFLRDGSKEVIKFYVIPQFWNTPQEAVVALKAAVAKYTLECGKRYNEYISAEQDNPYVALVIHE